MNKETKRADFMTAKDKIAMGNLPRTHGNCLEKTGVKRPGKTAHERSRQQHKETI